MEKLLVIDMQNAWLNNPATPRFDTAGVVGRINHATAAIRARGGVVVHIQHANEEAIEDTEAWNIIAALDVDSRDLKVRKRACDSFADTGLDEVLGLAAGDTLYVCGFATEFCVDTTVRAAASRPMNVIAMSDAHTTSNRPHVDAPSIIAHHNWIWTNMAVPRSSSLKVMATAEAFPAKISEKLLAAY